MPTHFKHIFNTICCTAAFHCAPHKFMLHRSIPHQPTVDEWWMGVDVDRGPPPVNVSDHGWLWMSPRRSTAVHGPPLIATHPPIINQGPSLITHSPPITYHSHSTVDQRLWVIMDRPGNQRSPIITHGWFTILPPS